MRLQMLKKNIYKLLFSIILIISMVSFFTYAETDPYISEPKAVTTGMIKSESNEIVNEETIQDQSINYNDPIYDMTNASIATNDVADVQASIYQSQYLKEIQDAINSVAVPEVTNLPNAFNQPVDHPFIDDYFGFGNDSIPIKFVHVEKDAEKKGCMALTFDSAYINDYTYALLDILDAYNVKATFFMTRDFILKNQSQVAEILSRGHEIGNHSTNHPDFNKVKDTTVVKEILICHNLVKSLFGFDMCLFRFPYGSYSPRTVTLAKNLGYYPIQWTFDSIDWKNLGTDYLLTRFEENKDQAIREGAIILFHNGATYTPEALPKILDMIKANGLKCVRVSDLIYRHRFYLDSGAQYKLPNYD